VGLGIPVLFGQTEIDHVDLVSTLADSHQKVVGLDISVDKVSRVNVFDSRDLRRRDRVSACDRSGWMYEMTVTHELVGEKEDSLQAELSVAKVEQVFQRRSAIGMRRITPMSHPPNHPIATNPNSQQVQDHGVVITFRPVPPNKRHTHSTRKTLVNLAFVFQLRVLGFDGFQLDGDFFTRDDVDSQVDVPKGTGSDLLADTVLGTYAEIHGHDEGLEIGVVVNSVRGL